MNSIATKFIFLSIIALLKFNFTEESFIKNETKSQRTSRIVDSLFVDYDNAFRPDNPENEVDPLEVNVTLKILNFGQFDSNNMRFTLLMELEETWYDMRLVNSVRQISEPVNLSGEKNKLWVPDIYFPKSESANLHQVTQPNFLVWFIPDGRVTFLQKLTVTMGCSFDLSRFPMDFQMCSVDIGSFGYKPKDIALRWNFGNDSDRNVILNTRELNELQIIRVESTEKSTCGEVSNEKRPCIQARFHFKRNLQYYIMSIYIPNVLLIIISGLSFMIDFTVAPARVTLGLVAVLTVITQTNMVYRSMPKISYIKAIDVWLFTCLSFVIIALLEFAFVNSFCRDGIKPLVTIHGKVKSGFKMLKRGNSSSRSQSSMNDLEEMPEKEALNEKTKKKKLLRFQKATGYKIDGLFLFMYPIGFILFNIIYWTVYLNLKENDN